MADVALMLAGLLGGLLLKDYLVNIFFPRQAPRLVWVKIQKVLPKHYRRETYRAFKSDYRRENSLIIKLRLVVITLIYMHADDDDNFPNTSC